MHFVGNIFFYSFPCSSGRVVISPYFLDLRDRMWFTLNSHSGIILFSPHFDVQVSLLFLKKSKQDTPDSPNLGNGNFVYFIFNFFGSQIKRSSL